MIIAIIHEQDIITLKILNSIILKYVIKKFNYKICFVVFQQAKLLLSQPNYYSIGISNQHSTLNVFYTWERNLQSYHLCRCHYSSHVWSKLLFLFIKDVVMNFSLILASIVGLCRQQHSGNKGGSVDNSFTLQVYNYHISRQPLAALLSVILHNVTCKVST